MGPAIHTVAVVETNTSGHRLLYVSLLVQACEARGMSVQWWTSPGAEGSSEAMLHLAHQSFDLKTVKPEVSRRTLLRMAYASGADAVVVPDGDAWLPTALLAALTSGDRSLRILLMRPPLRSSGLPARERIRLMVKRALILGCRFAARRRGANVRLFALTDAFGYSEDATALGIEPIRDPVSREHIPDRKQARSSLGIADEEPIVALLGAISARKNPELVAKACKLTFADGPGRLLLAGSVTTATLDTLQDGVLRPEQLLVLNGYLDDEQLNAAAVAADIIAVVYTNHDSSSGILALAAQSGSPVVVPSGTRLGAIVERGHLGRTAEVSPEGLATAMRALLATDREVQDWGTAAASRLGIDSFVSGLVD